MSRLGHLIVRIPPMPPALLAIFVAILFGAVLLLLSGGNPGQAYAEILAGSLLPANWPDTLNWATPLVGMTLTAAIPLRGGMINLGGDGQMVVGGFVAALAPLYLPLPDPLLAPAAILLAMLAAGLYALVAAAGETQFGIPMLISSLLLSYLAIGIAAYLAGFPLRDVTTGLAQTAMIPEAAKLPSIHGPLNVGLLLIGAVAIALILVDRRTVDGYELRLRGLNARFAAYGGVDLKRQAAQAMLASGAVAGLVGAIIVLGSQFRYQDGALLTPAYTWSGLMAALLAGGDPVAAVVAGLFFAALQTGGFAMQRTTAIPRELTMILQAIIILFLAMRYGLGRRKS
jgi:general nucleoside transport system permease protein